MGNVTSLTDISNKEGVYYKSRDGRTFPLAFVDTPMVITGIGVPDTSAPFVNVSFDGVSKTGYSRCIFWGYAFWCHTSRKFSNQRNFYRALVLR